LEGRENRERAPGYWRIAAFTIGVTLNAVVRVTVHAIMLVVHPTIVMAAGTCPLRCIAARMTLGADAVGAMMIHRERVIESRITPVVGVVTLAALAREVVVWSHMARLAIRLSLMVERGVTPVAGVVAGAALPRKVIRRLVAGVA
jgi:hypothetical protein